MCCKLCGDKRKSSSTARGQVPVLRLCSGVVRLLPDTHKLREAAVNQKQGCERREPTRGVDAKFRNNRRGEPLAFRERILR